MKTSLKLADSVNAVCDLVFPRRCVSCGRVLSLREKFLCIYCLADLPYSGNCICPRNGMSDRFNSLIQKDQNLPAPGSYVNCASLFFYRSEGGYSNITKRLKYHGDIPCGRFFSRMLSDRLKESPLYSGIDAVIPVPLHPSRKWRRGFNQAEIIGRTVAERLGAAVLSGILVRRRRTSSQTRLSIKERSANVEYAFRIRRRASLPEGVHHILLVDDVFTTGATMFSCYKALRAFISPEIRISVATLACVGE